MKAYWVFALPLLGVIGCSDKGVLTRPKEPQGELSSAIAARLIEFGGPLADLEYASSGQNFLILTASHAQSGGLSLGLFHGGTPHTPTCSGEYVGGSELDQDGDFLPASAKITFACSETDSVGIVKSLTGDQRITDANDNDAGAGGTLDVAKFRKSTVGTVNNQSYDYATTIDAALNLTKSTSTLVGTFDLFQSRTGFLEAMDNFDVGLFLDIVWTPDSINEPALKGSIEKFEGFVSFSGSITDDADPTDLVLSVKGEGLTYDTDYCSIDEPLVNGSVSLSDANGNVLKLNKSDCVTTWTLNDSDFLLTRTDGKIDR